MGGEIDGESELTTCRDLSRRWMSTMSARIRSLVTEDKRPRAARTIAPRFIDEQGSSANSCDAALISPPGGYGEKQKF